MNAESRPGQGAASVTTTPAKKSENSIPASAVGHGDDLDPSPEYLAELKADQTRRREQMRAEQSAGLGGHTRSWGPVAPDGPDFSHDLPDTPEGRAEFDRRWRVFEDEHNAIRPFVPPYTADDIDSDEEGDVPLHGEAERRVRLELGTIENHHVEHRIAVHPLCRRCPVNAEANMRRWLVLNRGRPPVGDRFTFDDLAEGSSLYLDLDDLDDLTLPPALIDGVLPRGANAILRGRDGTFKTFVALDWALHVATGRPWRGHAVEAGRVLYIAGEGHHGIAKRVRAWEGHHGVAVPRDAFTVRPAALNMHTPGPEFAELLGVVERGAYALVCIDTLRRVSGGADENGSEMGAVVDNIERVKRATADGSTLSLSHTTKGDTDTRGFSGIEDDIDVVWHAKRDDGAPVVTLKHTKMKDGEEHKLVSLEARKVGDSLVLVEPGGQGEVNSAMNAERMILNFVRYGTDATAVTGAAVAKGAGVPSSTTYEALPRLVESGHLVNVGTDTRPKYRLAEPGTT